MNDLTDQQLLLDYTEHRSEPAFTELVRRHVDFVYSAALRMVRDAHLAEDVAQGVFVALARSAQQLSARPVLNGWLHRTARNLAANVIRRDARRRAREQEAAAMNQLQETEASWEHIAPHLDAALGELNDFDRDALLLRYFERKSAREMAETLGITDDAAQKRVSRAVEHLRELFVKRGVAVSAGGVAALLTANGVQAAPFGLVATLSSAALASAATGSGTLTLLKLMTMTKLKVGVISSVVVAGAVTSLLIQNQSQARIREVEGAMQQQADQLARLRTERERLSKLLATRSVGDDQSGELLRLRDEAALLRQQTNDLAALVEENRRLREPNMRKSSQAETPLQLKEEGIVKSRVAKDFMLAFLLCASDNQNRLPASFDQVRRYLPDGLEADPVLDDLAEFIQMTNQFEIVYRGAQNALTNAGNVIVLREKQAQRWPDGKWSKVYGFADGHSETHGEADGNFDAWEKQRIVTPANR